MTIVFWQCALQLYLSDRLASPCVCTSSVNPIFHLNVTKHKKNQHLHSEVLNVALHHHHLLFNIEMMHTKYSSS